MINRVGGATIAAVVLASLLTFPGTAYADDKDCSDFDYREQARAYFDKKGYSPSDDPEKLDSANGRGDGDACESLPRRERDDDSDDDAKDDSDDAKGDDSDSSKDDDDDSGDEDNDSDDGTAPAGSQTRVWPRESTGAETGDGSFPVE